MTPEQSNGLEEVEDAEVARVGPVTVDELFDVLSRPGNRYVLTYLLLQDEAVSIVDLVEYVLDETETPPDMERAEFSGQLLHRFIETVLPELDERGLVDYDRQAQMIAETDATALTLPYLRAGLQQASPPQSERSS